MKLSITTWCEIFMHEGREGRRRQVGLAPFHLLMITGSNPVASGLFLKCSDKHTGMHCIYYSLPHVVS